MRVFVLGSIPGLSMPDSQEHVDADLDDDGFICGIALSNAVPLGAMVFRFQPVAPVGVGS